MYASAVTVNIVSFLELSIEDIQEIPFSVPCYHVIRWNRTLVMQNEMFKVDRQQWFLIRRQGVKEVTYLLICNPRKNRSVLASH